MEKAVFQLGGFLFEEISLKLGHIKREDILKLNFIPSGVLHTKEGIFDLTFEFSAAIEKKSNSKPVVYVKSSSRFIFNGSITKDKLPDYFYANSIAIVFPYVRAFVSTLTLQAGMIPPIILPTLNLSSLQQELESNVKVED
jgi:preprotein translocase subunit SecB